MQEIKKKNFDHFFTFCIQGNTISLVLTHIYICKNVIFIGQNKPIYNKKYVNLQYSLAKELMVISFKNKNKISLFHISLLW